MAKKTAMIFIRILIMLLIFQMINIPTVKAGYLDNIIKDGTKFVDKGKEEVKNEAVTDDTKIKETSNNIYNTLLALGIVFAVIIGAALGIQIMWGSIEQQVKAKEMLMPYAAGCLVTFGAFGIWKLCVTIFSQL